MCCTEVYNQNFVDEHPELTARLVLASALSTKYMYEHPYSAAMMFAKEFGTSEASGLRTMYLKTNAEGRTLNWEISGENIDNLCAYQEYWGISEENRSTVTTGSDSIFDLSFLESCGIESFDTFLEEAGINEKFPVGMSYSDWLYEAEEIDGIDHSSEVGKNVEKWMDGEVITEIPLHGDSEG